MSYGTPPGYGGGGYGAPPPGGGYGGAYGQPPQQPYGAGGGGYPTPPPNHLVWAILTLFCCQILGILSIVFAAQVNGKFQSGDYAGAVDASNKARTFAIIGMILGVLQWIGVVIYIIAVGFAVSRSTPNPYITSTY